MGKNEPIAILPISLRPAPVTNWLCRGKEEAYAAAEKWTKSEIPIKYALLPSVNGVACRAVLIFASLVSSAFGRIPLR